MTAELVQSFSLWLPGAGIMLMLIFVSGFFSGSETAIFSLTRNDLQSFRNGSPSEKRIVTFLTDPSRVLTAILFWNLVVNLSYFAVSVVVTRRLVLNDFEEVGWLVSVVGVITIILFGEVLPKSLAVVFPRSISRRVVWPLSGSVHLLDRVLPALTMTTRGLMRGFWPHLAEETVIDADDLEKAVDLSSQSNEMIAHERAILHHILDLSEITAEEIMRPRGTYLTVGEHPEWKDLGHATPPGGFAAVVDPASDQVEAVYWMQGAIYNSELGIESFRETVVYVPWCAHAALAMSLMRSHLCHVAAVVNEYGQTIGVLTSQDLLDSIFTSSPSRARRILKREAVLKIGENRFHLDGLTTLRFLAAQLALPFDPDVEPSVTVAGLFHEKLKRFPEVGDDLVWQGWSLRVIDVAGPGRVRVLLEPAPEEEPEGREDES